MAISKQDLNDMNDMLSKGKTISQIDRKYSQYDYWEIYWAVNDSSFLGKKRTISNKLKKLVTAKKVNREILVDEAQELLDDLYHSLKSNSKKLIDIDRVIRR